MAGGDTDVGVGSGVVGVGSVDEGAGDGAGARQLVSPTRLATKIPVMRRGFRCFDMNTPTTLVYSSSYFFIPSTMPLMKSLSPNLPVLISSAITNPSFR